MLGDNDLSGLTKRITGCGRNVSRRPISAKGPAIAFAIMRASTAHFGATEFGVRFWSPLLAAGTSLLLFYFARRLFSETAGLWLVLALNATPIFNIGSFVMTIDPLSIFFWTAAMFTFWWPWRKPRIFLALAAQRACWLVSVSLQIHQRARAGLHHSGARARASAASRIQASRICIHCSGCSCFARFRRSFGTRNTPGLRCFISATWGT